MSTKRSVDRRGKEKSALQFNPRLILKISLFQKHNRLVQTTTCLLQLIKEPTIGQIILTKHLGDVLAILIQLSSAPLKKPSEGDKIENDDKYHMTKEKYEVFVQEQKTFKEQMLDIVSNIFPPLVVKYLLLLQSCGASQVVKPLPKSINVARSPTPKWVQAGCGHLLTHLLTSSPNGVLNIIQGILDVGDDTHDMQRYVVIANVISNPPSTGKYADLEEYFKLVCAQILSLLDKEDPTKVYHTIACHCVRALTERSMILSGRYLLEPLFDPLLRLTKASTSSAEEIVTEIELETCLKKLHLCFVVINDPSLMFISHLKKVIMVLLELHCRINFGVSHLKNTVEELVQRFLKWSSKSLSLATIRAFALNHHGKLNKSLH